MSIIVVIGGSAILAGIGETVQMINRKAKLRARRYHAHKWA